MTSSTTQLAIIGSGSGNSIITPFWNDKRVVLAEMSARFGGTCLNAGCIPTKMLVRTAAVARSPEEAARLGIGQHTDAVDWAGIRDRVFGRTDAISDAGRRYRADELDNVTLISQQVRLESPSSFVSADGDRVSAEQLVIAAGSRPVMLDVPGIDLPQVHTSDSIMRIDELPRRMLIVGGGAVACEFASIFSGLGVEVTQAIRGDTPLRHLDAEIRDAFHEQAARRWRVRTERTVRRIVAHGAQDSRDAREPHEVLVELGGPTGEFEHCAADLVLVAIGRRANSDLIGAADAGIDLHDDGRIVVDAFQRVQSGGEPVAGVYALGDVSSPDQLKHVANHQARVVAHNLEHPHDLRDAGAMPVAAAIFTHPELATVGLTETVAAQRIGREHLAVKTQRYGDTAYGWAMEDTEGICKVVADRRDGTVLGAHIMGYQASNLIQPFVTAMTFGIDAHTMARGQYWPHPALMEVVENALLGLGGD